MSKDTYHIPLLFFLTYMGCKSTGWRLCLHSTNFSKYLHYRWGPPCSQTWPTQEKSKKPWGTDQPPLILRLNFPPRYQTTKNRVPQKFLGYWAALQWPWGHVALETVVMCCNQSWSCVSPAADLTEGKNKVRRLRKDQFCGTRHIDLGKNVYTLNLSFQ